jgi:ADP-heptose:LPS heptosyltransferase
MRRGKTMRITWLPTGGHIGDAIMILSLFAEIIRNAPDTKIHYLVRRNATAITDLATAYPEVIVIPIPNNPIGALRALLPIFKHRAIVVAPPSWGVHPKVIKFLAALFRLRGDTVLGFEDGTHFQPWNIKVSREKQKERYIDSLRRAVNAAGIKTEQIGAPPQLKLAAVMPKEFPFVTKKYFVIHPFPHMATFKTIPLRRWKDLVEWLRKSYPDYGIVITGAEVDKAKAEEITDASDEKIYLAVNRSLLEVAGLIEHSALYIGVDTGPTHIAGVLSVPSVVLAHQNEPAWLPSYNPNAVLLWSKEKCVCGTGEDCTVEEEGQLYRRCVYYISDEMIHDAISAKIHSLA